jgi:hypothetical protein
MGGANQASPIVGAEEESRRGPFVRRPSTGAGAQYTHDVPQSAVEVKV